MAPQSPNFSLFPKLPFELRCLIWEKTYELRIVEVSYEDDSFFLPARLQWLYESASNREVQ